MEGEHIYSFLHQRCLLHDCTDHGWTTEEKDGINLPHSKIVVLVFLSFLNVLIQSKLFTEHLRDFVAQSALTCFHFVTVESQNYLSNYLKTEMVTHLVGTTCLCWSNVGQMYLQIIFHIVPKLHLPFFWAWVSNVKTLSVPFWNNLLHLIGTLNFLAQGHIYHDFWTRF